jgi:hypothetical protein
VCDGPLIAFDVQFFFFCFNISLFANARRVGLLFQLLLSFNMALIHNIYKYMYNNVIVWSVCNVNILHGSALFMDVHSHQVLHTKMAETERIETPW